MPNILSKVSKKAAKFAAFSIVITSLSACSEQTNSQKTGNPLNTKKIPAQSINTLNSVNSQKNAPKKIDTTSKQEIFLSHEFNGVQSQRSVNFSCEDKIYLIIQFDHHPAKLHQIDIRWKDPNDEEREHNQFPYFVTGEQAFAWSALKLHRSVGAGMLQWINPAAGMEEFIGEWTVNIKINDLLEEQIKFEVLC